MYRAVCLDLDCLLQISTYVCLHIYRLYGHLKHINNTFHSMHSVIRLSKICCLHVVSLVITWLCNSSNSPAQASVTALYSYTKREGQSELTNLRARSYQLEIISPGCIIILGGYSVSH